VEHLRDCKEAAELERQTLEQTLVEVDVRFQKANSASSTSAACSRSSAVG